jgi:uncharacterized protein
MPSRKIKGSVDPFPVSNNDGLRMSYSFLELAAEVLAKADHPLRYEEIWATGEASGLAAKLKSTGKTPWQSLGAQLYVDVRDNPNSRFVKVGKRPARFFLAARKGEISDAAPLAKVDETEADEKKPSQYREIELHRVLTYAVYADPSFNRARPIYTKTIRHQLSKKSGYSEWTFPDLVGFSVPFGEWQEEVIAVNKLSEGNALTLFSFELKRALSKSNYRESFFQAVSNSSWSHQGYLVAAEIDEDEELLSELVRLSGSFGIGVAQIDLESPEIVHVRHPARTRPGLDWDTLNKLCESNQDFRQFLESVQIDVSSQKIHASEYDPIDKDIASYVRTITTRKPK